MQYSVDDLLYLMSRLRDPDTGCPWDIKQTFESIVPSTIEEAYEVADAIGRQSYEEIADELGDLLFQVIFYAQMAKEEGRFDFSAIVSGLVAKLVRRHPHVFPDGTLTSKRTSGPADEALIKESWEQIKAEERASRGDLSIVDSVPSGMTGLVRAQKLGKRVANVGFDWSEPKFVIEKVREELAELEQAIESGAQNQMVEELGDLLFSTVQLARHLGVSAEQSMQQANQKFISRFKQVEQLADQPLGNMTEQQLEALWQRVKKAESLV